MSNRKVNIPRDKAYEMVGIVARENPGMGMMLLLAYEMNQAGITINDVVNGLRIVQLCSELALERIEELEQEQAETLY